MASTTTPASVRQQRGTRRHEPRVATSGAENEDPDAFALAIAVEELFVRFRRIQMTPQLSTTAASVLRSVAAEGPQRVSDLAVRIGISQPGMTQLVDKLTGDGLVSREADPLDGRAVLVHPTAAGRTLVEARRVRRAQYVHDMLDQLAAADRAAVLAAVPALGRLAGQS